jgi:hypothetical protein
MIAVFDTNIVIDALNGVGNADHEYSRYERVLNRLAARAQRSNIPTLNAFWVTSSIHGDKLISG